MILKSGLVFHLLILSIFSFSQTAAVRGKVTDETGNSIQSATVSLLNAADSALIKMNVSDPSGAYEFVSPKNGSYIISVSGIGFNKSYSTPFTFTAGNDVSVPTIALSVVTSTVAGVVVQARRPLIENKIDKMVVNVDAAPTNAGATALEVLEKSPGISVDRDGNISLRGKQGLMVLMDGKQTYLSGQDLANLLRNMPASQLDQIEIITQPSAKFDASGNSGVINLRTKRNLQRGLNGTINLSYVQGRYPKSPNSFAFNYRTPKINFFSNLGFSYFSNFNEQTLLRTFSNNGQVTSVFDQVANQYNSGRSFNGRMGVDYMLNSKTTIGFMVNGNYRPGQWQNRGRADISNGAGILDSFNIVKSDNKDTWKNVGTNLNFRKVLAGSGNEFTADLDMIRYDSRSRQASDNFNYFPNGNLSGNPFLLRGNLPSLINIYSGKADYVRSLKNNTKLEAGVKSSYVETDNDAQYTNFDHATSSWIVDNTRSNHFIYKENINAAYISMSRQVKAWGFQGGLRLENTIANGDQLGNAVQKDSAFTRNYTQLFPTAFISYDADQNNKFGLSYGRRIERPNYQDMNPFQYFLDQYTYRQGNPNLTPQFTHNIQLNHIYKGALNTSLSYSSTTDILNDILKQNDATKVTFQTKENIASRKVWGLAISYNKAITGWWTTSIFTNFNYNKYDGFVNNTQLDVSLMNFMANSSQVFRFAKTWNAELSGFYRSRTQETGLFITRPMGVISFGFGKQIMKNNGTLKLNFTDPFFIQMAKVDINFGNINAYVENRWDNRRVAMSFSYRFSKGHNTQQQRKRSVSSQEEQNRVGGNQ